MLCKTSDIDKQLQRRFSPDSLREFYFEYKSRKTDHFQPNQIEIQMGADGVTYEAFEKELDRNVNFISKKVLSGSYLFYPFREVEIDKPGGGKRTLSIASIRDVIVQQQLYNSIYPVMDRLFRHPFVNHVSFAYRKGRSAPQAASYVHNYLKKGYIYALDADIVKYFDSIPHEALLNLLKIHLGENSITYKLTRRFILTDRVPYSTYRRRRCGRLYGKEIFRKIKPDRKRREKGVPQGGVLSGMLANLYLHEFDRWIMKEVSRQIPLRYVRYADDFVILTRTPEKLEPLRRKVASKLSDIGLELHTDTAKTRLVNVADDDLRFVGFRFSLTDISVRERNIQKFKTRFTDKIYSDSSWNISFRNKEKRLRALTTRKLNYKILGIPEEKCSECDLPVNSKPKSWMGFFAVVTNTDQLRGLDKWIRAEIAKYFLQQYNYRIKRKMLRKAGLASIEQEYYRIRKIKPCECINDKEYSDSSSADEGEVTRIFTGKD